MPDEHVETETTSAITDQLSPATARWIEKAKLARRKERGQYMTPRVLRDRLLDQLDLRPGIRVLDPGVGTGEFLRSVLDRQPDSEVVGWDIDDDVLAVAHELVPEATLVQRSALDPYTGEPFDIVIGNPPYFQFKPAPEIKRYFAQVISGRPNIFALFFQAGLEALKPVGTLAYVVPPSMNNGAYFEALREYIVRTAVVVDLKVFNDPAHFPDAQTAVQTIVIAKSETPSDTTAQSNHVFRRADQRGFKRVVFAEDAPSIAREFKNRRTLADLGYEAVTGTVVWNQHTDELRREPGTDTVPLLWAHNIVDGRIEFCLDHKRPQYIAWDRPSMGPAIVTNRIVGSVGSGTFKAAFVEDGMRFVGENHVNIVRRIRGVEPSASWQGLLSLLRDPATEQRIRRLTGNTQVSATELTHMVPLGP